MSEPVLTEPATPAPPAPEIVIYSSAICPYCVAAKNFLKSKGQVWREVRIDLDPAEREKMMAPPAAPACRRSSSAIPTSAATTT